MNIDLYAEFNQMIENLRIIDKIDDTTEITVAQESYTNNGTEPVTTMESVLDSVSSLIIDHPIGAAFVVYLASTPIVAATKSIIDNVNNARAASAFKDSGYHGRDVYVSYFSYENVDNAKDCYKFFKKILGKDKKYYVNKDAYTALNNLRNTYEKDVLHIVNKALLLSESIHTKLSDKRKKAISEHSVSWKDDIVSGFTKQLQDLRTSNEYCNAGNATAVYFDDTTHPVSNPVLMTKAEMEVRQFVGLITYLDRINATIPKIRTLREKYVIPNTPESINLKKYDISIESMNECTGLLKKLLECLDETKSILVNYLSYVFCILDYMVLSTNSPESNKVAKESLDVCSIEESSCADSKDTMLHMCNFGDLTDAIYDHDYRSAIMIVNNTRDIQNHDYMMTVHETVYSYLDSLMKFYPFIRSAYQHLVDFIDRPEWVDDVIRAKQILFCNNSKNMLARIKDMTDSYCNIVLKYEVGTRYVDYPDFDSFLDLILESIQNIQKLEIDILLEINDRESEVSNEIDFEAFRQFVQDLYMTYHYILDICCRFVMAGNIKYQKK